MATPLDPKEIVTLEEPALANIGEGAALVEVLGPKGIQIGQEGLGLMTKVAAEKFGF